MTRLPATLMLAALSVVGQTPLKTFDVTSVRVNKSGSNALGGYIGVRASGRVSMQNVTLRDLVRVAYSVRDEQISGGSSWVSLERFDVQAQAGGPVSHEQGLLMLQALLQERFKLNVRDTVRQAQGFTLQVAKGGPKLKPADKSSGVGFRFMRKGEIQGPGTIPLMAKVLADIMGAPIEDRTQIEGAFDIDLKWTPEDALNEGGLSIFTAIKEQLGLQLIATKVDQRALAIEAAEMPDEN